MTDLIHCGLWLLTVLATACYVAIAGVLFLLGTFVGLLIAPPIWHWMLLHG